MKCKNCIAYKCESNEDTSPPYYYCWYGEKYEDEHGKEFADGSYGCLKRRKTIERDMEKEKETIWKQMAMDNLKAMCKIMSTFVSPIPPKPQLYIRSI